MQESVKKKTVKGLAWSGVDKVFTTAISFVIGILIARILSPEDYGVIGILTVFITFSNIFVNGGMPIALVQKNKCTEEDYNTAFWYNLIVAVFLYLVLFFSAPLIADFYEREEISNLLRVLSLSIIISCFSSVHNTRLLIKIDFKKISISSIVSSLFSGIAGLVAAMNGFAIWALVIQQLSLVIIKTIILNVLTKWYPKFSFSIKSFYELFSFGSKLIFTDLLARIYDNLYPLIIGKFYTMSVLGNYSRGQHFSQMPVDILKEMFQRVSFPVMSSIKNDRERLAKIYRIYIMMSSAVIFPIMFTLILIAKPLVVILLTEKWIEAYPYMQILCFGFMFNHISAINLNLLYVEGRSDLALKLELVKKSVAITILFISILGGIWGICIGQAFYSLVATILNSKYTKTLIGVSYWEQIKDYGGVWVLSAITIIAPYMIILYINNNYLQLFVGIITYVILYISIHVILKTSAINYLKEYIYKIKK